MSVTIVISECMEDQKSQVFKSSVENHVLEKLNDDRLNGKAYCDVIIDVAGQQVHGHRIVLGLTSSYFADLLKTAIDDDENIALVKIDGEHRADAVESLVSFLYLRSIALTSDNVLPVLRAAHTMQEDEVMNFCGIYLQENLHADNCLSVLRSSKMYNLDLLEMQVKRYISSNLTVVMRKQEICELAFDDLMRLLGYRTEINEVLLCETVVKWVKFDYASRNPKLVELMKMVDFKKIKPFYLYKLTAEEPMLKGVAGCSERLLHAYEYHVNLARKKRSQYDLVMACVRQHKDENKFYNLLSYHWFDKWMKYVCDDGLVAEDEMSTTAFLPSPGPIDNACLFHDGEFKKELKCDKDYIMITSKAWNTLVDDYSELNSAHSITRTTVSLGPSHGVYVVSEPISLTFYKHSDAYKRKNAIFDSNMTVYQTYVRMCFLLRETPKYRDNVGGILHYELLRSYKSLKNSQLSLKASGVLDNSVIRIPH